VPLAQPFGKATKCVKCDRVRTGGARYCIVTDNEFWPTAPHIHWRCTCSWEWLTWPADNPHGTNGS